MLNHKETKNSILEKHYLIPNHSAKSVRDICFCAFHVHKIVINKYVYMTCESVLNTKTYKSQAISHIMLITFGFSRSFIFMIKRN